MNKDTKGVLKIRNIIGAVMLLVVGITSTHITTLAKQNIQVSKEDTQAEKVIEVAQDNLERSTEVTSRSNVDRSINNEQEETEQQEDTIEETKYISIDEITISKDMDLSVRCGISKEDFKILMANLKPDTTKFFYDNSDLIYDLCEEYEINEVFFCGLIAAESGWKIASNHRNACNYISMMSKGSLIKYSTPEEGLEAAAKLLHNRYLTEGGSYYNGKTIYGVQKCYCPESTWVGLVYGCMKQIVK